MIDYEKLVKEIEPDAQLDGCVDVTNGGLLWWIEIGIDTIGTDSDIRGAWKDAYDNLISIQKK